MSQLTSFSPVLLIFLLCTTLIMLSVEIFFTQALTQKYQTLIFSFPILILFCFCAGIFFYFPNNRQTFFDGHFVWDPFIACLVFLISSVALLVFAYAMQSDRNYIVHLMSYYSLALFSLFGMIVLVTSGSVLSLYLGIELMTLPIYAMITLNEKSIFTSEAAMKYILMNSISSACLLYGLCLLYGISGELELSQISKIVTQYENAKIISIAGVLAVVAFLFKLGVAPFHWWVPDVYESATTSTTLFLATLPKIALLGIILRVLLENFSTMDAKWQIFFLSLGLLSIILGNTIALSQENIKRFVAYTSLSHMGFILLSLTFSEPGYTIALNYLLHYSLSLMSLLGAMMTMHAHGISIESIQDLGKLQHQHPLLSFLTLIAIGAMAGLPPFVGFFIKLDVLQLLMTQRWYVVSSVALISTLVGGMYYYIQMIKWMYFTPFIKIEEIKVNRSKSVGLLVFNVALVLLASCFQTRIADQYETVIASTPSLLMEEKLIKIK